MCVDPVDGAAAVGRGVAPVAPGVGTGLRMPIQEMTPPITRKTAVAIAARWYPVDVELRSDDHAQAGDRDEPRDAGDRVVHGGSDAGAGGIDRAEDRRGERRDGHRHAESDDDEARQELHPVVRGRARRRG